MRRVSETMTTRWMQQAKTGDARPVVRATIQPVYQKRHAYNTADGPGGDVGEERDRVGNFTSVIFGSQTGAREIRNIKSFDWSRSVNQDIAEATLTLLNTDLTPIGNQHDVAHSSDFDMPGYFTFNRGDPAISANRWGYDDETGWNARYVPDRLVRTYEGYGGDSNVEPAYDENLEMSGTWMIDEVTYSSTGDLQLKMRDVGRMLVDQIAFPPVVPPSEYPMLWSRIKSISVPGRDAVGGHFANPRGKATSSNKHYIGEGISDTPQYVDSVGGVLGHYPEHARIEGHEGYWLSTSQVSKYSKVWWEVDLDNPANLAAIRLQVKGGPYRIFISLQDADGWIGRKRIPYTVTTEDVDNFADIPFVHTFICDAARPFDITLRRKYPGIRKVRITFSQLKPFFLGKYQYRAALWDIKLYTAPQLDDLSFEPGEVLKVVGNYRDFTAIVKWIGAWCGWFWPEHASGEDFIQLGETGPKEFYTWTDYDTEIVKGRVWGDFHWTATGGEADLTPDQFDKQPMLDVISHLRDITGFNFWIDETGAMVWRLPNLWALGNYTTPHHLTKNRIRHRTTDVITLDENETLLNYATTLSSRNLRERVFVANTTGKVGTVIRGYNPYPQNFRRIAGWTDMHWESDRECRVAADMISARQMFSYRTGKATIPGYPAIQIDDQVRIFERVTNETYYHYVTGISSSLDMEAGTWNYELDTHWLGERPSDAWVVRVDELDEVTQEYLLGVISANPDPDG